MTTNKENVPPFKVVSWGKLLHTSKDKQNAMDYYEYQIETLPVAAASLGGETVFLGSKSECEAYCLKVKLVYVSGWYGLIIAKGRYQVVSIGFHSKIIRKFNLFFDLDDLEGAKAHLKLMNSQSEA